MINKINRGGREDVKVIGWRLTNSDGDWLVHL